MFDTMAPMALAGAHETAARLARTWVENGHREVANREGWNVFGLPEAEDGATPGAEHFLSAGIERYDDPSGWTGCSIREMLESDDAAVDLCQGSASAGSRTHTIALELERALNAMRRHLWGERYVGSRIGPPGGRADATGATAHAA